MSDLKKFSDALKTWRIQKNLTQKEVADRMGISRSVLSFLENGVQYPKMKHLVLLQERCGLDLSYTITGNDSLVSNQVSEPRPYFGAPMEMPQDMAAVLQMINTRTEVKKDIVIMIRLMNQMQEEFRALTVEGRKNMQRIQDMLLECQMML